MLTPPAGQACGDRARSCRAVTATPRTVPGSERRRQETAPRFRKAARRAIVSRDHYSRLFRERRIREDLGQLRRLPLPRGGRAPRGPRKREPANPLGGRGIDDALPGVADRRSRPRRRTSRHRPGRGDGWTGLGLGTGLPDTARRLRDRKSLPAHGTAAVGRARPRPEPHVPASPTSVRPDVRGLPEPWSRARAGPHDVSGLDRERPAAPVSPTTCEFRAGRAPHLLIRHRPPSRPMHEVSAGVSARMCEPRLISSDKARCSVLSPANR
jgi:hypothetical protein